MLLPALHRDDTVPRIYADRDLFAKLRKQFSRQFRVPRRRRADHDSRHTEIKHPTRSRRAANPAAKLNRQSGFARNFADRADIFFTGLPQPRPSKSTICSHFAPSLCQRRATCSGSSP